jgi:ACS family glucarate transporter-like MFS transporter
MKAVERPDQLSRVQLILVALMFGLSVMSYFDRTIMSIAGPSLIKESQLSETAMGTVYSAFTLGYALLMVPGGRLADRFGPRRVLAGMALGSALFTGLTPLGAIPGLGAYLGIIPSLIVMRLGFGFCTAPLYPTCGRMNANWIGLGQRGRVQGIVNAGAGLGGAVAPVVFAWMITAYGWRVSFCAAAAATGALGVVWLLYARDTPPQKLRNDPSWDPPSPFLATDRRSTPWLALCTDRSLLSLTAGYCAVGYFQYIFFYWIYYYLGEIRGLGARESAVYTTALFLTFGFMMSFGGWLSDRAAYYFGRKAGFRLVGMGGLGLSAVFLYLGTNVEGTTSTVALMALALGCSGCSDATFWAATIEVAGEEVGSACGILNTGGNIGGLIAPVTTPLIAARLGWSWGLYFGSGIAVIGLLTWLGVDPTRPIRVVRNDEPLK